MSTEGEIIRALASIVDWSEGVDLHGVSADEVACRWDEMRGGYSRKEIFLRARPKARYAAWHRAMDESTMDDLVTMLDPDQIQVIVDILTRHGEITGLHYASEFNTTTKS